MNGAHAGILQCRSNIRSVANRPARAVGRPASDSIADGVERRPISRRVDLCQMLNSCLRFWRDDYMKNISGRATLPRLAAVFTGVILVTATALAQHRTLTAHVPQAVANGQAAAVGKLPRGQRISLAISLPLRDSAGLEDLLQQIYDPQSPSYRHYLSVAEFTERFGPTQDDHDAIVHFAEANGLTVTGTRANRLAVDVEGPVEKIETALHVTMGTYQHPSENRIFYAPDRE